MKWTAKIALITSCILITIVLLPHSSPLHAASPKKKLSTIEKKIKTKKRRVKEALKKEQSILTRIQKIEKDISNKESKLKEFRSRISNTKSEIRDLEKEMSSLSKKLDKRKSFLKERLKSLYKQKYGDGALILISAKDYNDLVKRSRYISLIAYNDNKMMTTYIQDLDKIKIKITTLELMKKKLSISRVSARNQKKELQHDRLKKDRLLTTVRSKRSSYQKAISELEVSSKKLRAMIKKLQAKKIPNSVLGKGFKAWKRRLPWPMKGRVVVPYGKYKDPKFNIAVFKNGIEIKAKAGHRPTAVAGGRVVFADWFKGYGQLLIINHGDGFHSLYGHLTEIFHKTGDIIKQGTSIGKIGTSELLGFPTLYFEIRHKGKPVDPMKWLRKTVKRKR